MNDPEAAVPAIEPQPDVAPLPGPQAGAARVPAPTASGTGPTTVSADGERLYTVDELAREAGVPTRTVRHYQSEGVLPPPEKHGRIALYRPAHLERMELIARLQDRGLSLKVIRDALREAERGEVSLDDWLGMGDELRAPWSADAPAVLPEADLAERLAGRRAGLRAALVDAGLVAPYGERPGMVSVPSPALLDLALSLVDAGVDPETAAAVFGLMRKRMRKAAADVADLVVDRAGDGFGRSASTDDVGAALDALRSASADAVHVIFAQEVEKALAARATRVVPTRRRAGA